MANDHIADDRKKVRLIDANEMKNNIMEAMMRQFEKNGDQIALRIAEMMCHFVDVTDTVDAVEVVHGRWENVDHDGSWRVDMCSICHRRMHYVDYDQPYQYCPNCGAKMDGDGNG